MVTHEQLTVGWCVVFKIEIHSSFYCTVLISSVCSLPFQGVLCASLSFFMMLSPTKFLPFALGFSTLDLPLFLLSTNYCLCILMKGGCCLLLLLAAPAPILQLSKEHSPHRGTCLRWILMSCFHRCPLLSQKALCGLVWGPLHPGEGFVFCLGVCLHACVFPHTKCNLCRFKFFLRLWWFALCKPFNLHKLLYIFLIFKLYIPEKPFPASWYSVALWPLSFYSISKDCAVSEPGSKARIELPGVCEDSVDALYATRASLSPGCSVVTHPLCPSLSTEKGWAWGGDQSEGQSGEMRRNWRAALNGFCVVSVTASLTSYKLLSTI